MEGIAVSRHSLVRMQQRGITSEMVAIAVRHGVRTWSHGAQCYRLTERSLRTTVFNRLADRLRGLCVVIGPDKTLITVKWDFRLRRPGPDCRSKLGRRQQQDNASCELREEPGTISGS